MGIAIHDQNLETLGRDSLAQIQLQKLQMMLAPVLKSNEFYRQKFNELGITAPEEIQSFEDYWRIPFTTKQELSADQQAFPPYGNNLTFPASHYTHVHQTSGTAGNPLLWLDTEESWNWWASCWATVYNAAGVLPSDKIFFGFSFGPFIGFWSAYEGARVTGALAIPGGGMSSFQRLKAIITHEATVLVCTPTYALRLAEVAAEEGIDIANSKVRITIHAGEPGASIPSTKERIESTWDAECFDHAGATEVGAWGFGCSGRKGLHINEAEFICEVIDPQTGEQANEGELVITNLGRVGMPIIRYRTGDRVRIHDEPCECGRSFLTLEDGVIGRIDDALIVRGVTIFPSGIENIVRRFSETGEFAVDIYRRKEMDDMELRLEVIGNEPEAVRSAVSREIHSALGLRINVVAVPFGTLPRFDMKARRFNDHRNMVA